MLNAKDSCIKKETPIRLILRSSDPQIQYFSYDFKLLPPFASSWASQSSWDSTEPHRSSQLCFLSSRDRRPLSTTGRVDQGVPPALLELP